MGAEVSGPVLGTEMLPAGRSRSILIVFVTVRVDRIK